MEHRSIVPRVLKPLAGDFVFNHWTHDDKLQTRKAVYKSTKQSKVKEFRHMRPKYLKHLEPLTHPVKIPQQTLTAKNSLFPTKLSSRRLSPLNHAPWVPSSQKWEFSSPSNLIGTNKTMFDKYKNSYFSKTKR